MSSETDKYIKNLSSTLDEIDDIDLFEIDESAEEIDIEYWDYRIIHKQENDTYKIGEVYFNADHEPVTWVELDSLCCENYEDLKSDIEGFYEALTKPIIMFDGERLVEINNVVE